ncbi:MAG: hypothetical protein ACOC0N_05835 [Chroococcales cyanobacterium]
MTKSDRYVSKSSDYAFKTWLIIGLIGGTVALVKILFSPPKNLLP